MNKDIILASIHRYDNGWGEVKELYRGWANHVYYIRGWWPDGEEFTVYLTEQEAKEFIEKARNAEGGHVYCDIV